MLARFPFGADVTALDLATDDGLSGLCALPFADFGFDGGVSTGGIWDGVAG